MRIDHLSLENFNGFARRDFSFNPRFNLLVGDNATGKTSVIDALAVAIGSWFLGLRGPGVSPPGIGPDEVRLAAHAHLDSHTFEKQFPSRIECTGEVMGRRIGWIRELQREGGRTTSVGAKPISDVAIETERRVRAGEEITLPLVCTYGAERLWFEKGHQKPKPAGDATRHKPSRFDGYRDCLDNTIQETALIDWIRNQATASLPQGKDTTALTAVKSAIAKCVEGAKSLYYDGRYNDLVILLDDRPQLFRNLSDGQRIMLTLVGDLASRAAILNPHLADAALRDTPGVVTIDELDLHLHPKWQRRVIHDLKVTFPSLQFIATTHSPQLIGEALPEEIRLLDGGETTTPPRSFGIDSSRVLEEVMGARSRDRAVDDLLKRLFQSIDDERFEDARGLLVEVEAKLGPDDPEATRAHALMSFLESKI
jgi:predicted ATP-binding protein involved in virulence